MNPDANMTIEAKVDLTANGAIALLLLFCAKLRPLAVCEIPEGWVPSTKRDFRTRK